MAYYTSPGVVRKPYDRLLRSSHSTDRGDP